jgi:hypothetical protein
MLVGPERADSATWELRLREMAAELNKTNPRPVDAGTRIDSVTIGPGLRMTYHYSLINERSANIDADSFARFTTEVVLPNACRSDVTPET